MDFENDIFVIGEFINSKRKEEVLISLISSLKQFNIPILLTGHYPVSSEIQEMCDYYLFDKENPMLSKYDMGDYGIECLNYWVETNDWDVYLHSDSHDYCVWTLMRNATNFVESIGKKTIHYIDYDNLPNLDQYKNEVLLPIKNHDAVVFDIPAHPDRYATFIYSIKTNIATNIFNRLKTKDEYYKNNIEVFIEERFFRFLNEISSNIKISKYKSNGHDLALCSKEEYNNSLTNSLITDGQGKLYGYFTVDHNIKNLTVDIEYMGVKKNEHIPSGYSIGGGFGSLYNVFIIEIGEYRVGETVKIYYNDTLISTHKLDMEYDVFKKYNKITFKN